MAFSLQAAQIIDVGFGTILFSLFLMAVSIRLFSLASDFDPYTVLESISCNLAFGSPQENEAPVKTAKKVMTLCMHILAIHLFSYIILIA